VNVRFEPLGGTRGQRHRRGRRVRWVSFVAPLLLGFLACRSADPFDQPAGWPTPARGAVVSEHALATEIGMDVLRAGGNAADAAVATALALAVVFPMAGNLGGGGFALWVPHTDEPDMIDFRETAPAAADGSLYVDADGKHVPDRSLIGPLAVAIPGSPMGLFEIHRRWGSKRFRFDDLARPAIELARDGFVVDGYLADMLAGEGRHERMNDGARAVFYPGGRPLREGELLLQPQLARTLQRLAANGPRGFYQGRIADAIVDTIADERGEGRAAWMTHADLAAYEIVQREPLRGWYRGMEVITVPPPSSGGIVLLQVLSIFEGLPVDAERDRALEESRLAQELGSGTGSDPAVSARFVHWLIESLRRAFADRALHMGDPDSYDVPVAELLSPAWIAERRVSIGERADPDVAAWAPAPPAESAETTHLSVLDRDGNALCLTTTLNGNFGSGILVEGGGFFLNNEIDDFAVVAGEPNMFGLVGGEANALRPGGRPLSSMTPTVVRDGGNTVAMVVGSPGGPRIITAVLQVILRVYGLDQTLEEAVLAPRLHQQWKPALTTFERGWSSDLLGGLQNRHGQETAVVDMTFGSVQAIHVPAPGMVPVAVSDPRRSGRALVEPGTDI